MMSSYSRLDQNPHFCSFSFVEIQKKKKSCLPQSRWWLDRVTDNFIVALWTFSTERALPPWSHKVVVKGKGLVRAIERATRGHGQRQRDSRLHSIIDGCRCCCCCCWLAGFVFFLLIFYFILFLFFCFFGWLYYRSNRAPPSFFVRLGSRTTPELRALYIYMCVCVQLYATAPTCQLG